MRGLKRLLIWTLIPVIIELTGLLLVDKIYLNDETTFSTTKVDVSAKTQADKINVKVPDDANNFGISYTGNYISYCDDDGIKIINTSNNKKEKITFDDGIEMSAYKWLADRDILFIAEKIIYDDGSTYLRFESYNPKDNEKSVLSDDNRKELKILLNDDGYNVTQIALSSLTNVTYVKVDKEGYNSKIYRINVMAQAERVRYPICNISSIAAENKEDRLIYQDSSSNRIRVYGLRNPIATGENAIHYLLNVDNEDNIYIGNGENNIISKIFVANLKKTRQQWKIYTLSQPVQKSNIYITASGKVYINDPSKNTVTELVSGKQLTYTGSLIKAYDEGIIYRDGNKIIGKLI